MGLAVMEASGLCATIFEFVGQAAASPSTPLVPSTEGVTAFDGDVVGIVEGVQNQTAPSPVMIAKEDGEKSDTVSGGDGGTRVAFQHRPGIFRDDAVKLRGVDCSRGPRSHQQLAEGQMMLALVESKMNDYNLRAVEAGLSRVAIKGKSSGKLLHTNCRRQGRLDTSPYQKRRGKFKKHGSLT